MVAVFYAEEMPLRLCRRMVELRLEHFATGLEQNLRLSNWDVDR